MYSAGLEGLFVTSFELLQRLRGHTTVRVSCTCDLCRIAIAVEKWAKNTDRPTCTEQAELEDVCGRHAEAVSELEAARGKAEHEVAQLTQRLDEGDGERKDLELRLESAGQELATTVQLSELALAARVSAAEDERLEKERKLVAEKTRLAEELVGRVVICWC